LSLKALDGAEMFK